MDWKGRLTILARILCGACPSAPGLPAANGCAIPVPECFDMVGGAFAQWPKPEHARRSLITRPGGTPTNRVPRQNTPFVPMLEGTSFPPLLDPGVRAEGH